MLVRGDTASELEQASCNRMLHRLCMLCCSSARNMIRIFKVILSFYTNKDLYSVLTLN